jgi:CheY-like chemotaxis protein
MQLARSANQQPTVLVVDDDQDNLALLEQQVSLLTSCLVITAANGSSALLLAQKFQPDLILLDMMLPDMDGLQVARSLKHTSETKEIPVVAVTAMASVHDEQQATAAGCDDYLRKPYELENLEAIICHYLHSCSLSS